MPTRSISELALFSLRGDAASLTHSTLLSSQAGNVRSSVSKECVLSSDRFGVQVFMLGAGGVIAVACSNAYGRLPVLFWMILLSVIFAILNAASRESRTTLYCYSDNVLTDSRGLCSAHAPCSPHSKLQHLLCVSHSQWILFCACSGNGVACHPCALIVRSPYALRRLTERSSQKDLFFFHEQIAKTNIWAAFFILSPYLGPIISAAVLSADPTNLNLWRWSFGEFTILSALALLGICLFADETWYNRNVPEEKQPSVGSRLQRLTGIGRPKENTRYTIVESSLRLVTTLAKPPVLMVCISFGLSFAWVVGINTTLPIFLVPIYNFGDKEIALFYFTPIVATILGESVGHCEFIASVVRAWPSPVAAEHRPHADSRSRSVQSSTPRSKAPS